MNTLNQALQAKFPHLEVSVLKLSEVQRDNETKRIDSEFFKKEYLENEKIILKHEWDYLGNLAKSIINFGAYSLCNYIEYVDKDDGVPFLNVGDIRENSINYENAKYIPFNTSKNILHKSLAKENQVLLTIAGSIGFAAVSYRLPPFTNSNQAIANIEILTINPFYLSTYLNCRFGKSQMNKLTMSSVQPNLLLTQVKQIKIPLLPMPFQLEIEKLVKDSHLALEQSKALYKEAETLLYVELGLDPANPIQSILQSHSNDINFRIATLKESFLKTGRLDSEYYQSKYGEIEKRIKSYHGGYCKLRNIGVFTNGSFIPESYYAIKSKRAYIRIKELSFNSPIRIEECVYINDNFQESNETIVKENDFVIATIGNTIGKINRIPKELEGSFISNNTSKFALKDENFNPYYMELLLRSVLIQEQIQREFTQTAQPKISNTSLENILIPKISSDIQASIAQHIQTSFALRAEAKNLLNEAKAKVESTISGGGGVNNASFVAFRIQIFRIYFPQIKAKLRDSKRAYRLGEWELLEELLFSQTTTTDTVINYTIATLKQTLGTSGRLDSEYYQSKYEKNEAMIKSKPYARLKDIVEIKKSIEPGSEAYTDSGIPFIRVSNLGTFGISQTEVFLDSKDFKKGELESLYPKKDMILLSKDGSVGIAYYVEKDLECVTSGAILHLTIKNQALVLPQYLSLVLNALPTKLQAQRDSGGSIIAHWKISEIENLLIPLLELSIQEKIESKITQSFALRAKSKELLEEAKVKVEEKISLL